MLNIYIKGWRVLVLLVVFVYQETVLLFVVTIHFHLNFFHTK